jgi:hypothetical protein
MHRRHHAVWRGRHILVLASLMTLLTIGLATPASASTVVGSNTFDSQGNIDSRSTAPCWVFQDTWEFGNALGVQGSGTYHIYWCANSAKTKITSIPKAQFWCSRGPSGYYSYDGCDKHRDGPLPLSRVRFTIHWKFHVTEAGLTVSKTLTVDGYIYPDGRIQGTASCC